MGNLKALRVLLACIEILESMSTNSVNAQCQDRQRCEKYRFPLVCEGIGKEWYLKNCPKSCKACPADQLSKMYVDNSTLTLISSQSTIREEINVTDVNKVPVQPERTTGTTRILLSTVSSQTRRRSASKRVASVTAASGTCKDDNMCTRFKDFPRLCPGTNGWYRQHCRLSCNMCITDQVSVTRDIFHTSTISPVRSTNVSVQVHSDSNLAPSHPQRTVVTTWIPSSAAPSHPQRTLVTTWIPSSAGDGQNMEWVMNNIAVTVLTPILVILVIVIIVITRIKGRKVVLTPQREQSKVVVTYSGVTPQPEKQAYTAIDLEAHTYSSVDDIRHETEDYQNINDRGSQHIGMNQDQCTSDSRTVDCTLYENAGKKMGTEDTDNYIHICENKSKSILK